MEFHKIHFFSPIHFFEKGAKLLKPSLKTWTLCTLQPDFFCLLHQETMKGSSQVSKPNFIQTETNPITAFSLFFSNVCCLMLGTLIFGCMYQKKKVCAIQPEKSLHSLPLSIVTWVNYANYQRNANFFN